MKVKICGITNIDDAKLAVDLGADMLGFIFYDKSPRYIDPTDARKIIDQLPSDIIKIGVFVDESINNLMEIKKIAGIDKFQLHGNEIPEFCAELNDDYIKAIRVKDSDDIGKVDLYNTDKFLFDTYVKNEFGGTGKSFNWKFLSDSKLNDKFVILSGGLNSENVIEAISIAKPDAIDVSSGVEASPGIKDIDKMTKFFKAVKDGSKL